MLVLAIESSHDDTSVALVENQQVIFNYQISQIATHAQYGGTIPEIASREHYDNFYLLLEQILDSYYDQLKVVDAIVYTKTPGLIGALQMGQIFAHALAHSLNKPIYPINHLDGHIFSVLLTEKNQAAKKIDYPALALIVSGGHTNLYYLESPTQKSLIGQTLDDALGEVFDKVGRTLNLAFPAGKQIDLIYQNYLDQKLDQFQFSVPKLKEKYHFSFSGFKTQVINLVQKQPEIDFNLIAATFQKNVIDYVIKVVKEGLRDYPVKSLILGGGVSANSYLRIEFKKLADHVLLPELKYSTDNGAMIGAAYLAMKTN